MSRAFVKELDTEYLEELPSGLSPSIRTTLPRQAWRRSNMPWRRPAKPMPPHRPQPIARRLPLRAAITKEKVAVVFGCWTSASRKSVLPIFELLNGLLYYPVQYEGEESSRNIFYTGAAPNQPANPAVRYLMSKEGGEVRRWVLLGTDYVYPRTTNRILSAYLTAEGVSSEDIMTIYTPFSYSDWQEIIKRIKAFGSEGKRQRSYQPLTEMRIRTSTGNS
jgi:Periplasmic binding protein domain